MDTWARDIEAVLFDEQVIRQKVCELGDRVTTDYADLDAPLVLIGILKGALFFLGDLAQAIALPIEMDLMSITSYHPYAPSAGVARIVKDLDMSITDRHVLIVEGIVDTGMSLNYLLRNLSARRPAGLKVCTFLDKPARRSLNIPIAYRGFTIEDQFVVGYGLDFHQQYRNLPFIGVLKDEAVQGF